MPNIGNTQQQIAYGASANDGTGDPLRTAFIKTDENFDNVWLAGPVGSNITIINNTVGVNNTNGNLILSPNGVGNVQFNRDAVPRLNNTYNLGAANLTWRSLSIGTGGINTTGNLNLSGIANLQIAGGVDGYVIQTDGAGNLTWVAQAGGGPVGPSGAVQINWQDSFSNQGGTPGDTYSTLQFDSNGMPTLDGATAYQQRVDYSPYLQVLAPRVESTDFGVVAGPGVTVVGYDDTYNTPRSAYFSVQDQAAVTQQWDFGILGYGSNNYSISDRTSGNAWTFGTDGNLTLPANTFAVNYANGDPVVISGGGGAAGNAGDIQINVAGNIGADSTLRYVDNGGEMTLYADYLNAPGIFTSDIYAGDGSPSNITLTTSYGNATWTFGSDGSTLFPTLTTQRGDNPSGTIQGQTLLFGDATQEAIISTPDGVVGNEYSQRLVINPGAGNNYGEGGDIYLWAGRGGDGSGTGGDIKIRGGQGGANTVGGSGGDGGYIRINAGDAAYTGGNPGYIDITGGYSNTVGGYVNVTGGQGAAVGGDVKIYGGYGSATGGNVNIWGGASGSGQANEGNVNIQTGGNTWTFGTDGNLTAPGNISAVGNITGGNIVTSGSGGNITLTGGDILGAGNISAAGNITGNYFIGNGSQLTGITASVPSQTILPTIQTITVSDTSGVGNAGGGGSAFANVTVANTIPVTEYGVIITSGTSSQKYATGALGSIPGTVKLNFTTGLNSAPFTVYAYVTSNAGTYYSNAATGTSGICLLAGTQIALSDGTRKAIEDITYTDKMLSWDFDRGCYAETTALWIKRGETGSQYNLLTFSDGTTLRTFDQHRIFNKQAGAFTYPMTDATPVGTVTVNEHGQEITLTNKQVIIDTIEYYNVITDHHMNLFSDTVLTSCRFNNIYPITDMKFVKDGRTLRTRAEFENIPDRFFYGLRLAEQTTAIETVEWYVNRLLSTEVSTESELTV